MLKQFKFANDALGLGLGTSQVSNWHTELEVFKDKPFWIWPEHEDTGNCCANHLLGLPIKNGIEFPIFEYEKLI